MAEDNGCSNNVRPCGQIGDGEDDELSIDDFLDEQTRLQAHADAVLGGSDENNCTYPKGYIKRQALYACATCTPNGIAGICLACSYACHEGHELHELYTKRYFTCDCGNEKFGGRECKLFKGTKGLNASNHYNQNFKGLYCSCARPYPDPEDTVEDEMIQCIICEDWYHERHLKTTAPDSEDFHEMTCPDCMSKYAFLWAYYTSRPVKPSDDPVKVADETIDVCVGSEGESPGLALQLTDVGDAERKESFPKAEQTCTLTENKSNQTIEQISSPSPDAKLKRHIDNTTGIDPEEEAPSKKVKQHEHTDLKTKEEKDESIEEECILKSLQQRAVDSADCAVFWQHGWRSKLCRCHCCLQMYKDRDIEFLIDELDTVIAYEEKGRDSASSVSEDDTTGAIFAGMGRVQQIEIVRGIVDFRTELNEFLLGFAERGKVVTETDIREFFQRMDQRRKDRMQVPQYSCR